MPHSNKKMISFFLTTKCNLCCRYCYNAKERNCIVEQTLNFEIAKNGIDWYFNNNPSRHIRFYGPGEPTQEFEMLKRITEYAKNHPNRGSDVTVEIQTNGVFTEAIRSWALENFNIIWMSFDGMKEIQDYNRPLNPQYAHGITDNSRSITSFRYRVTKSLFFWMNRRSQRRSYQWSGFLDMLTKAYPLAKPRIYVSIYG